MKIIKGMPDRKIFKHVLQALFMILIISCSRSAIKNNEPQYPVVFPPPPDIPRIQYLTSLTSSTEVRGNQSAINMFIFGKETPQPIIKPYGVAVRMPRIYVCDSGLGGLVIIDLSEKSFKYFIPTGRGMLQLPLNCALDKEGFLYVADANRRQIVVFDGEGNYVSEFGENDELFRPTDVVVSGDKVFVTSVKDQRIFVYDRQTGRKLYSFPDLEPGDQGYLYQPTNLSFDKDFIYVSDMGDNMIKIYSADGKFIRSAGGYGNSAGKLIRPKGVAVDPQSNLYVVDAAFENVQIFNETGNILMFFGGPYKTHGDMWLPADVAISTDGLEYFNKYIDEAYNLEYLIFVTNQYGPDKLSVYGFIGSE